LAGRAGCICNLANTCGYSVAEVVKIAERVTGKSIRIIIKPRRPGDPPALVGLAERAQALLDWAPQRSDLTQQIADAWRWLTSQSSRCEH